MYPLLRDVGMASKTLTGFGIKLRIYWDFGTGCHTKLYVIKTLPFNILYNLGMSPKYLLGCAMGPIFYWDGGMEPPGTDLIY